MPILNRSNTERNNAHSLRRQLLSHYVCDLSALFTLAARRDPTRFAQRATFEKTSDLRKAAKQKSADLAALFVSNSVSNLKGACSASGDHRRLFGTAADEPRKKQKNSKSDHCLGRQTPAGFLNVIVHDVLQDLSFGEQAVRPPFRLVPSTTAGYDFARRFATAKNGETMARPSEQSRHSHYKFRQIIGLFETAHSRIVNICGRKTAAATPRKRACGRAIAIGCSTIPSPCSHR